MEYGGLSLLVCLNLIQNKQPKLETEPVVLCSLVLELPAKGLVFQVEKPTREINTTYYILKEKRCFKMHGNLAM